MTAGANLDPQLGPRVADVSGIVAFIVTKAAVLFAAGPALGLAREAARWRSCSPAAASSPSSSSGSPGPRRALDSPACC